MPFTWACMLHFFLVVSPWQSHFPFRGFSCLFSEMNMLGLCIYLGFIDFQYSIYHNSLMLFKTMCSNYGLSTFFILNVWVRVQPGSFQYWAQKKLVALMKEEVRSQESSNSRKMLSAGGRDVSRAPWSGSPGQRWNQTSVSQGQRADTARARDTFTWIFFLSSASYLWLVPPRAQPC